MMRILVLSSCAMDHGIACRSSASANGDAIGHRCPFLATRPDYMLALVTQSVRSEGHGKDLISPYLVCLAHSTEAERSGCNEHFSQKIDERDRETEQRKHKCDRDGHCEIQAQ